MADPVTLEDIYELFRTSQAEADRRFAESKAEADRRAAEADRRLQKLEQTVERTSRAVDGLSSRWGKFVENLVEPAIVRLFQERDILVRETHPGMKSQRPGAAMEIDLFAVDDDVAVAVEVKSRLTQRDVDEFAGRLQDFKRAFPHYASYRLYGAVAGIEIDRGVDRYAYQKGFFVIRQTGETVEIANDEQFRPVAW